MSAGRSPLRMVQTRPQPGFDTPLVTVQVTTAEKTVTLRYASGMDGYYLMVEGDGSLYTVDQSTVQALLLPENAWKPE